MPIFRREPPLTGASNARGYDKMPIFSQISRCVSETVIIIYLDGHMQRDNLKQQEAQLSQRGRAMPRVVEYFG